jgi:sterol desaturase/sphingolipid hydroxylase (fatty acid hydroxylase superfamily)
MMNKVKVKGSARLFDNRFMELFSKSHPLIILSMYVPLCAFLLLYFHRNVEPSLFLMLVVFLVGVFSWTFFEYILHRFVFHYVAEAPLFKRLNYLVHGVHHEYPKDKQRLMMPPLPSLLISGSFFLFFRFLMGHFVFAFFSGFMIGYLSYAIIHYCTHAFRPPKNFLRYLWEYHSKHHFRTPDKAFGVSSPFWDYIFGTMPENAPSKKTAFVSKEQ